MITKPAGWTLIPGADVYTLVHPSGPNTAIIRYTERVRPQRRLGEIVQARIRNFNGFELISVGDPVRVTSAEGEYGAVVTVAGLFSGRPARAEIGVLFVDDFYARVEALVAIEEHFGYVHDTVRQLVTTDTHHMANRRRPYDYQPAAGWQPLVRGMTTDWISPEFPADWAMLTVHAAVPIGARAAEIVPDLVRRAVERGFVAEVDAPPEAVQTKSGLSGILIETTGLSAGAQAYRSVAAFADYRFVYALELVAKTPDRWASKKSEFEAFWSSIVPIPPAALPSNDDLLYLAD